jgi:hypothetical protein
MNISTTGGAGQNGKQAARYIPGMGYGKGKEMMDQQSGAPMFEMGGVQRGEYASMLPAVTPLTAPTERPNEPVTSGAATGAGPGNDALNLPPAPSEDPDIEMIRSYYPSLEYWASQPYTSEATKSYLQYLRTLL